MKGMNFNSLMEGRFQLGGNAVSFCLNRMPVSEIVTEAGKGVEFDLEDGRITGVRECEKKEPEKECIGFIEINNGILYLYAPVNQEKRPRKQRDDIESEFIRECLDVSLEELAEVMEIIRKRRMRRALEVAVLGF